VAITQNNLGNALRVLDGISAASFSVAFFSIEGPHAFRAGFGDARFKASNPQLG
jgi:hypothetical protein